MFLQSMFFEACTKKETLAQVLSWEFCEIFKSTFLQNTSRRLYLYHIRDFHWLEKSNMVWNKLINRKPDFSSGCYIWSVSCKQSQFVVFIMQVPGKRIKETYTFINQPFFSKRSVRNKEFFHESHKIITSQFFRHSQ